MYINNENKQIINNIFQKFDIFDSINITNNFIIYFCTKKFLFIKLKNPLRDYSNHYMGLLLSQYLHDKEITFNLDIIFQNVYIFASINNKLIKQNEIKQKLENLRITNMLTQNYEYDNWYLKHFLNKNPLVQYSSYF